MVLMNWMPSSCSVFLNIATAGTERNHSLLLLHSEDVRIPTTSLVFSIRQFLNVWVTLGLSDDFFALCFN